MHTLNYIIEHRYASKTEKSHAATALYLKEKTDIKIKSSGMDVVKYIGKTRSSEYFNRIIYRLKEMDYIEAVQKAAIDALLDC